MPSCQKNSRTSTLPLPSVRPATQPQVWDGSASRTKLTENTRRNASPRSSKAYEAAVAECEKHIPIDAGATNGYSHHEPIWNAKMFAIGLLVLASVAILLWALLHVLQALPSVVVIPTSLAALRKLRKS